MLRPRKGNNRNEFRIPIKPDWANSVKLLLITFALLAGCGTDPAPHSAPAPVAPKRQDLTAEELCAPPNIGEFTRHDCERMAAHKVWVGERVDMLLTSEGKPSEIRKPGQKIEEWVYPNRVVYLKADKFPRVISIQEGQTRSGAPH